MALLSPSLLPPTKQVGGWYREMDTIRRLGESLPEEFEIFHSIPLHDIREEVDRHGEIDVVVLGPTGTIVLIEIKSGELVTRNGHLFKLYQDKERDVGKQIQFQFSAILSRLKEARLNAYVTTCLVLPDYRIDESNIVSFPRERIIDSSEFDTVGTRVRKLAAAGRSTEEFAALRQFLRNEFRVTADLTVMREQVQRTVRSLADGMATWVPRITSPSRIIRIQATAGSGKTQLALRLLEDAASASKSAIYVCFNRSLADHVARLAPPRSTVSTFHELCIEHYRRRHGDPDFLDTGVFASAGASYIEESESFARRFDVLIVDEGQDFEPEWLQSLLHQLKPEGQLYLLEDADQRLYGREEFELPDAVLITSRDNFRSPRAVCKVINALRLSSATIQSMSPVHGDLPGFHVVESEAQMIDGTADAVERLLQRGFQLGDITILTGRGRGGSALLSSDRVGAHATRRFTGSYDRSGNPVWTRGDLLVESVYRYKGQSAPAIVLTEIDFEALTDVDKRKLFVGLTRAQIAVEIVLSVQAEACLAARLQGAETVT
jgi:hypothetical protein